MKYGYFEIFPKQPHANNGNKINVSKRDQQILISSNSPSFGHNLLKKILKAVLVSMYRQFFHKHFMHGSNISIFLLQKSFIK